MQFLVHSFIVSGLLIVRPDGPSDKVVIRVVIADVFVCSFIVHLTV
jgi:hypothetical protein